MKGKAMRPASFIMLFGLLALLAGAVRAQEAAKSREVTMVVTAYCPCKQCCGPNARGITASGKPVTANGGKFVAADRSVKFGTMIQVPCYAGDAPVPVLDRGGAIKGNRLDAYFPDHSEARRWGCEAPCCDDLRVASNRPWTKPGTRAEIIPAKERDFVWQGN